MDLYLHSPYVLKAQSSDQHRGNFARFLQQGSHTLLPRLGYIGGPEGSAVVHQNVRTQHEPTYNCAVSLYSYETVSKPFSNAAGEVS